MKENKKSKKEIFESIKKLNVSIDDLLNKKNKSKIETEKQEIDTEVLELRNRLNSLKKEHANSINNFSQRLTSLDNPHEVKLVKFKSSMLKFSVLYNEEYRFRKILITILLATFVSIATIFFIKNSGLFSAGISGVLQGVARLVNNSLLDSGVVTPEVADIIFNVLF
jgi:FtsZ-binding cell division protein ZapB